MRENRFGAAVACNLDGHALGPDSAAEPCRVREIPGVMGELHCEIGMLEKSLSELFERLGPVCAPLDAETKGENKVHPITALGEGIAHAANCIHGLGRSVNKLTAALEV